VPTLETEVLVVGGGSTGAGVARDAALRGLSTVLVERGDLAAGGPELLDDLTVAVHPIRHAPSVRLVQCQQL